MGAGSFGRVVRMGQADRPPVSDARAYLHSDRRGTALTGLGRGVLVVAVAVLVAGGMAGCGASREVVVQVAGKPITKAMVEHWMSVTAAGTSTAAGQPKPGIPRPPHYTACVAYKERYPTGSAGSRVTRGQLRSQCRLEYQQLLLNALYLLIPYDWVLGEAAELHVHVSPAEVAGLLATFKRQPFPGGTGFHGYLASTRRTEADIVLEIKLELLIATIQRKLEEQPAIVPLTNLQAGQALDKFSTEYEHKWKARTTCQPGYIVPICRQYKPTQPPPTVVPSIPLMNMNPGDRGILGYNPARRGRGNN